MDEMKRFSRLRQFKADPRLTGQAAVRGARADARRAAIGAWVWAGVAMIAIVGPMAYISYPRTIFTGGCFECALLLLLAAPFVAVYAFVIAVVLGLRTPSMYRRAFKLERDRRFPEERR